VVDQILEISAAPRTGPGCDGIPEFFRGATTRGLGQGVPRAGRRLGSASCEARPTGRRTPPRAPPYDKQGPCQAGAGVPPPRRRAAVPGSSAGSGLSSGKNDTVAGGFEIMTVRRRGRWRSRRARPAWAPPWRRSPVGALGERGAGQPRPREAALAGTRVLSINVYSICHRAVLGLHHDVRAGRWRRHVPRGRARRPGPSPGGKAEGEPAAAAPDFLPPLRRPGAGPCPAPGGPADVGGGSPGAAQSHYSHGAPRASPPNTSSRSACFPPLDA
jgi:hypothetical protein